MIHKLICFSLLTLTISSGVFGLQQNQTTIQQTVQSKGRNAHQFPGNNWPVGGDVGLSFDFFRSLPEGSWAGNSGAYASFNLATPVSPARFGFGFQVGGSYGLYDWNGRGSTTLENMRTPQQQGFVTGGLFRHTPHASGWNAGLVFDLMINAKMGVFALNPILGQIRGQLGYLIYGNNEAGIWATCDTQTSHEETGEIPVQFRAISQVNLFWTHLFKNRAQTKLWVGTPYRSGLMYPSGRAGNYLFGASFLAPLTRALSITGHASYMGARGGSASQESSNYAANISFGVSYSFGGSKAGVRPYLPLADNSSFLIDTNLNE